jgi:hypothetical protein
MAAQTFNKRFPASHPFVRGASHSVKSNRDELQGGRNSSQGNIPLPYSGVSVLFSGDFLFVISSWG